MQGTPRPSQTILGEVHDNGFFLPREEDDDENEIPPLDDDDLAESSANPGGGRPRGTTLDPDEEDNKSGQPPPISLTGQQPVLPKQLQIVTDLMQQTLQSRYFELHDFEAHLLAPHYLAKTAVGSAASAAMSRADKEALHAQAYEQLKKEVGLDKEEARELARWRAGECMGRRSSSTALAAAVAADAPPGRRRFSASAMVPAADVGVDSVSGLLPPYEERVRVLSLVEAPSGEAASPPRCPPPQLGSASDFVVEVVPGNGGRHRVHCQVYEFAGAVEDAVFDALARTSDAVVINQPFSDAVLAGLVRLTTSAATTQRPILVLSRQFGRTPQDAKKLAQRLGAILIKPHTEFSVELAARSALIRALSARLPVTTDSNKLALLQALERQTRRMERKCGAGAASPCTAM